MERSGRLGLVARDPPSGRGRARPRGAVALTNDARRSVERLLAAPARGDLVERWAEDEPGDDAPFAKVFRVLTELWRLAPADALRAIRHVRAATSRSIAPADDALLARLEANVLVVTGRAREAIPLFERAWNGFRAAGDRDETARVATGWSFACAISGDPRGASAVAARGRRLLGRSSPVLRARLENNVGTAWHLAGRFEPAKKHYRLAATALARHGQPDMAAACRYNLGLIEILEGQFRRARRHLERARDELGRDEGSIYALYARVGLAELDLHEGEWDRGFDAIRDLRARFVDLGDERAVAWLHRELARVFTTIGAVEAAVPEAAAARVAFRRLGIAPEAANVAFLEGRRALTIGALVDAYARFDEARAHWDAVGNRRALQRVRLEIARTHLARGDADAALASATRTVRALDRIDPHGDAAIAHAVIAECHLESGRVTLARRHAARGYENATHHPARFERPRIAVLLARVHAETGDSAGAVRWARRAVADLERTLLRFGRRQLRMLAGGSRDRIYPDAIDLVLAHGGPRAGSIAVDLLARARSPSLIEDLLQGRGSRLEAETRVAIARLRDELLAAPEEGPSDTRARALGGRIREMERRLGAGPVRPPAIVRDALKRRAFSAWRDRVVDCDVVLFDRGATGWRALVVHPGGTVDVQPLPRLDDAIQRHWLPLRITLETAAFAPTERRREFLERTRADGESLIAGLGRALWEAIPLATSRAIVVPWDELHALPIEALTPDGIVASRLPHPVLLPARRARRRRRALLLHGRTPGSRGEVERVARVLNDGGYRVTIDDGRRALLRRTTPVGVLHVAAHGTFHRDGWFLSGIQLADGSLGFEQLGSTQLRGALVQFTSCESGQTRSFPGSDVDGWITAGLAAGAREMVLTLWKIDDEAGATFAEHFYRAWTAGDSAATSAARAREAMRQSDPHPFRWAPFAAVG